MPVQRQAGARRRCHSENDYRRPSGPRASEGGSWSSPDRPAGGGLARHKSETLAALNRTLQPATEPKSLQRGLLREAPSGNCVRVLALVRRGTRRWGPALAAVLVGLVRRSRRLRPRPAAGSTGVPAEGRRGRVLPSRIDGARRSRPQRRRRSRPEAHPARHQAARARVRTGLAADVGYAIKGRVIDLWFP